MGPVLLTPGLCRCAVWQSRFPSQVLGESPCVTLGKLFCPFLFSINWAGENCLRTVRTKSRYFGVKPQGALHPDAITQEFGDCASISSSENWVPWEPLRGFIEAHVCCDCSADSMGSSGSLMLLGRQGQGEHLMVLCVDGQPPAAVRPVCPLCQWCAQAPWVVHGSSHHPWITKVDNFLVSGTLWLGLNF